MNLVEGFYMAYVLKEIAVSLVLFIVFTVAIICCFLGLSTVLSNSAKAAEGKVSDCTIWQITNTGGGYPDGTGFTGVRVRAVTSAEKKLDRLATAKWLAFNVAKTSKYDFIDVLIFGEGTLPNERDLTVDTAVAGITLIPGMKNIREDFKSALFGFFSDTKTSEEITAANGKWGNPVTETSEVGSAFIRELKIVGSCDTYRAPTGLNFNHPDLNPYVN